MISLRQRHSGEHSSEFVAHRDSPIGGTGCGFSRPAMPEKGNFIATFDLRFKGGFEGCPNRDETGFSISKFVQCLDSNAYPRARGICATNIRKGLEAGGLNTIGHPKLAKDYGPFLEKIGFSQVSPRPEVGYVPKRGDVMVFQPVSSATHNGAGHIQVWGGFYWLSDFKQLGASAPWPGPAYKKEKPLYAVYRRR